MSQKEDKKRKEIGNESCMGGACSAHPEIKEGNLYGEDNCKDDNLMSLSLL